MIKKIFEPLATHGCHFPAKISKRVGMIRAKFLKVYLVTEEVINYNPKLQRKLKKSERLYFSLTYSHICSFS